MTQTVRDTVTRAMRMLGVIQQGVTPTSTEATNGLLAYNAMLHGWKGKAVDVGHIDQTLNDNLAIAPEHHEGCTALLAVKLAPEFTVPVSTEVAAMALSGWEAIQAAYKADNAENDLVAETGLRRLSANRRGTGYYTG